VSQNVKLLNVTTYSTHRNNYALNG